MATTEANKTENVIPQWVCDIIDDVSRSREITLEQATKLLILHGALYYELRKEERKKYNA